MGGSGLRGLEALGVLEFLEGFGGSGFTGLEALEVLEVCFFFSGGEVLVVLGFRVSAGRCKA